MATNKTDKTDKQLIAQQLNALHNIYQQELPQKIAEITRQWQLLLQHWSEPCSVKLYGYLHKLAGSAGSFGFTELSECSSNAERLLLPFSEPTLIPNIDQKQTISAALERLVNTSISMTQEPQFCPVYIENWRTKKSAKLVYLLEDDIHFSKHLALQLKSFGYQVTTYASIEQLQTSLMIKMPAALLVDVMLNEGRFAGPQFIKQLREQQDISTPIIIYSQQGHFESRLAAVRAGADAYLVKPIDIQNLVCCLDKLTLHGPKTDPLRVLIVDDDNELAQHYAMVLNQAGIETLHTDDATKVCLYVSTFCPDLILMDLYIPYCNGIELSKIIRQFPQYTHIPIVFLSTEVAVEKQLIALRIGGDDFLTKPISDDFLWRSISIRAQRARVLNDLMVRDSLTGLLKHSLIKERLQVEVLRRKRTRTQLSFVMIDIDLFRKVNDQYGHRAGDQVLKSLSSLLRSNLRETDIVGRYGGEEFAIIMPECNGEHAQVSLEILRREFANLVHHSEKGDFSVTFSAGIAQWSNTLNSAEKLSNSADTALYQAKKTGRNKTQRLIE